MDDDIGNERPMKLTSIPGLLQRLDVRLGDYLRRAGVRVMAIAGLQAEAPRAQMRQRSFGTAQRFFVHLHPEQHGPAQAPARGVSYQLLALLSRGYRTRELLAMRQEDLRA
ncbi:hypothetical protein [Myxococcus eversor]|uniref:hypothetical protein n=1 Tax=Myxococcus eversor TaxID=2709661 RepID=UPI0013D1DCE0|nr:hypothetical protein [Myxococcus eversor]